MNWKYSAILTVTFILFFNLTSSGQQDKYCGIYSVYGAANALNHDVEFEELISVEFVSSTSGSNVANLVDALDHIGLRGEAYEHLTLASLKGSSSPIIIHVFSESQIVDYNHWILFLGIKDGYARVCDGNSGVYEIPLADLQLRWNGVGIVVSIPDETGKWTEKESNWWLCRVILLSFVVFCLTSLAHHLNKLPIRIQVVGLTGVVAVTCLYQHLGKTEGFLNNMNLLAFVSIANEASQFESISLEKMEDLIENEPNLEIIDARYLNDTTAGMIPNSLNIPVDSPESELIERIRNLDKTKLFVVYCQSRRCSFDRHLATRLRKCGLKNIFLLKEGWVEWKEFQETKKRNAS